MEEKIYKMIGSGDLSIVDLALIILNNTTKDVTFFLPKSRTTATSHVLKLYHYENKYIFYMDDFKFSIYDKWMVCDMERFAHIPQLTL